MAITDTIGNVLADDAVTGSKESLHNPFSPNPIRFVKSDSWKAEPGQVIIKIDGDSRNPKYILTGTIQQDNLFRAIVGAFPEWMANRDINWVASYNTKLIHKTNPDLNITSLSKSYYPFLPNVSIGFNTVEFSRLEIYDYTLETY